LPLMLVAGFLLLGCGVTAGFWYYFTPKYTRVGYQPIQPVAFSHATHVEQLGTDCRYCHTAVEKSWFAGLPSGASCLNCHNQALKDDPRLALVRQSVPRGQPIPWIQVHKVPDYVYFNHSVHVKRGVGCSECHGQIHQMDEVQHAQSFSMTFCLDCHRNPVARLRPPDAVTDPNWKWSDDPKAAAQWQQVNGGRFMKDWNVESLADCSACHR